ncbi:MAG: twin-arginine translocase subunit TatB [Alphaproteobacteria bacterium]|nr:twin-arginine translocase subunit TatB [Alphaproteobacteria bacterium]
MLDFSWSHILILLIVALVVVGPKDLPRMMRIVGQWMGKARQMANEFKRSFDDMARQSELEELRKEIESLRAERPLADVERELNQSIIPDDLKSPGTATITPAEPQMAATAEPVEIETAIPEPAIADFEPEIAAPAEPIAGGGYAPPKP